MKYRKIAAASALVVLASGVGAGTAAAQEAPVPGGSLDTLNAIMDQPLGGSTNLTLRDASAYISALTEGVRMSNTIGTIAGTIGGALGGCLLNGSTAGALAGAAPGSAATLPVALGLCVGGATVLAPLGGTNSIGPLDFTRRMLCMQGRQKPKPIRGCKGAGGV